MIDSPQQPWIDVDEIKRAVSIEQVLARYGLLDKLQRRGNTLRGLSPFRKETRPSFFVSLDKGVGGVWNDYPRPTVEGKEVPGNVVGLVMAIENCGFRDALIKLHDMAGLHPSASSRPSATAALAAKTSTRIGQVLAKQPIANEPFGKELTGLRHDVPALTERGVPPEVARKYGVGFCSRGLHKGRIVVPVRNRSGEIVAYIGRSLKDDDPVKWKLPNGFRRVELFGAERLANDEETRALVRDRGLIVVEGVFDAIHMIELGFKNTVSTLGSDVTEQQCELLTGDLNPTKKVLVFFDEDEAGRAGRKRLASQIIHRAFVRYADCTRIEMGSRTDPDQLTADEIRAVIS